MVDLDALAAEVNENTVHEFSGDHGEVEKCDAPMTQLEAQDAIALITLARKAQRYEEGGVGLIAAERERQVSAEGWSADHDDEHEAGEMAMAAACYASPIPIRGEMRDYTPCGCRSADECSHNWLGPSGPTAWRDPWPWDDKWDKREKHDRVRRLTIAGALIAAELDRLARQALESSGDE